MIDCDTKNTLSDQYYTSTESLLDIYEKDSRKMGYYCENLQDHNLWKSVLRKKLRNITGITKMKRCKLQAKKLESVDCEG